MFHTILKHWKTIRLVTIATALIGTILAIPFTTNPLVYLGFSVMAFCFCYYAPYIEDKVNRLNHQIFDGTKPQSFLFTKILFWFGLAVMVCSLVGIMGRDVELVVYLAAGAGLVLGSGKILCKRLG